MDKRTLLIILLVGVAGMTVWGFASFTVTSEVVSAGSSNKNVITPFSQGKPKETTENPESSQSNNLLIWAMVALCVLGLGGYLLFQFKQESRAIPRSAAAWDEQNMPPPVTEPIHEGDQAGQPDQVPAPDSHPKP